MIWIIVAASILTALLTGWSTLIIQSLATGGDKEPYFASELVLRRKMDDDYTFRLEHLFTFFGSDGKRTTAPRGMLTDGASVGALMNWPVLGLLVRWLIKGGPLEGPLAPGAVPHDKRYADARDHSLWRALISSERAEADRIIYEAACCRWYRLDSGQVFRKPLAKWRAFIVMAMLRVAGAAAWLDDSSKAQKSMYGPN